MDLHKFQNFILELNFNEVLEKSTINQLELQNEIENVNPDFCKVPLQFSDEEEYQKVWKPLFLEEVKANIVKSYQTESYPSIECQYESNKVDDFLKIDFSLLGPKDSFNQRDLVILSCSTFEPGKLHTLGLVENNQDLIRINFHSNQAEMRKLIKENTLLTESGEKKLKNFSLRKITALSTLEREYRALHKFPELHLKPLILSIDAQPKEYSYFTIPYKLDLKLHEIYNKSQYDAIQQTLKTYGITLIQGPPGTGKTKTVLGTLSVLLQSKKDKPELHIEQKTSMEIEKEFNQQFSQPWTQPDYDDWRDHIFDDVEADITSYFTNRFNEYKKDKPIPVYKSDRIEMKIPNKILVCGPSNASVDEIIRKILDEGLLDENGQRSDQPIVRIGENFDPTLAKVSLESLAQQRVYEQQSKDIERVKKEILNQAKIIFGTLSSTGSNLLLQTDLKFDTVIIDEAAQAVEISTLIPLQFGCRRLILIGDPNQLPATIFSSVCGKYKYDQSLFERLQKQGANVHLLKTQYRMHPKISKFISNTFYGSELDDYEHLMKIIGQPKFYNYYTYSPVVVLHVRGYELFTRNSYQNDMEAKVVAELYKDIQRKFPTFDMSGLGIVSPYSQQVWLIGKKLKDSSESCVEIKTVDGFQGREKDIIIFSSVRSKFISDTQKNPKKGVGFLSDARRMNVSLSRCRQTLIIVCDIFKISCNERWRNLVNYSIELGSCYRVNTEDIGDWFQEFDSDPLRYSITNPIIYKPKGEKK